MSAADSGTSPPRAAQLLMRKLPAIAIALAVLAALVALGSGLGHRLGLWDYRFGFLLLRGAAWTGLAGALACLAATVWAICRASSGDWTICRVSISMRFGCRPSTPRPCTILATMWPIIAILIPCLAIWKPSTVCSLKPAG